jgi:hypothetical protein
MTGETWKMRNALPQGYLKREHLPINTTSSVGEQDEDSGRSYAGARYFAILLLLVVLGVASHSPLIGLGLMCITAAVYVILQLAFGEYGADRKL